MNIPLPIALCLLGVLLLAFEAHIRNLTNKTVQVFKNILLQRKIRKVLREVTHILPRRSSYLTTAHIGVAKEIASPNSPPHLTDGWKYLGDEITFIICNDKNAPLCFWLAEKKILIWENENCWFFFDSLSKRAVKLNQKNSKQACTLASTARIFGKMSLRHHINRSMRSCIELEVI